MKIFTTLLLVGMALWAFGQEKQGSTPPVKEFDRFFTIYKYGTKRPYALKAYKEVNFDLTPMAGKNDCVRYKTYTGNLVDLNDQTATLRYWIEDSKTICDNTETNSIMEVVAPGHFEVVELPMRQVESIWFEPKAKVFFLTAAKVFGFTGLVLAPVASLELNNIIKGTDPTVAPHFDTKLYSRMVIGSAIGAGTSLGLYFVFGERNFSFFQNAKPSI